MKKNHFLLALAICLFLANSVMGQLTWKGTPPDPSLTTTGVWDLKTKSWTANGIDSTLWVNGNSATFNNPVTSLMINDYINCSSITANDSVTLTGNATLVPMPTLGGVNGTCNINIASGKYFNFTNVPVTAGTNIVKSGPGEFVCTSDTLNAAVYTINEGLFSVRGFLNGSTININGNCALSSINNRSVKLSKLNVNSNFTIGVDANSPSRNSLPLGGLVFSSGTSVDLGGQMRTITIAGLAVGNSFQGVISNGGLAINGSSLNVLKLQAVNTYTLGTVINSGTVELRVAGALPTAGKVTLNGGTLSGINYTQNCGTLLLTDNSTIVLNGSGIKLNFANSSSENWTPGKTLTVKSWSGIPGVGGTGKNGVITVTPNGLTAAQLAQINFEGTGCTGAMLTSSGEVVPAATGSTPPTFVVNSTSKVTDTSFDITFLADNADWRSKITSVSLNGVTLPSNAYDASQPNKVTFYIANCDTLLHSTALRKTFVFAATGYLNDIYSKAMISGDPTHLGVTIQPVSPLYNGGVIPLMKVALMDMYGNICAGTTFTNPIYAQATQSNWTLAGTTTVSCKNGVASFAGLTASSTDVVSNATITFTGALSDGTLINIESTPFAIPALTALHDVDNSSSTKIFTNPNKQITIISEELQNGTIAVYNLMGQKLISTLSTGNKTIINKPFKSGIYIVSLNVGGKLVNRKISIN